MAHYLIMHADREIFPNSIMFSSDSTKWGFQMVRDFLSSGHYKRVAVVEAEDLEGAYHLSNHIDSNWFEGPKVTKKFVDEARSTSVGDIIALGEDELYVVDRAGFANLGSFSRDLIIS